MQEISPTETLEKAYKRANDCIDALLLEREEIIIALQKIANHQWNCTHAQIAQEILAKVT